METKLTGTLIAQSVGGRDYEAFIPHDLPPKPPISWTDELVAKLTRATAGASRLDGAARLLPDLSIFLYTYIRKEAVLSSQIEGTQSSLSDLLMHESDVTPGVPLDDVAEVSSYVRAMDEGVARIRKGELISVEMLLQLHKILLSSGRGATKDPGKIRLSQNWIGGQTPDRAIFVPPPPTEVLGKLNNLVNYCNNSTDHILVKAALAHVQFETIHPFRDGNGRIGRLLITLLLCKDGLISDPLVYLSLYFKEKRHEYYDHLQAVRSNAQWDQWLSFFLTGIADVTESAFALTGKIQSLFAADSKLIRDKGGRKTHGMLELYRALQRSPVLTVPKAAEILHESVSRPTLYSAAESLKDLGIISTQLNQQSVTLNIYEKYMELLKS